MKEIIAVITDADIRWRIDQAAAELEEDGLIRFPHSEARKEFIEDCVAGEIDRFELYDRSPFDYHPDYVSAVLDMAELYEYGVREERRI